MKRHYVKTMEIHTGKGFGSRLCLLFLFMALCMQCYTLSAQKVLQLTIGETIELAAKQSPDAVLAQTRFKSAYWRYRSYKAQFLPSLVANGTVPDLNRSFTSITRPDGRDSFVYQSLANSSVSLQLNQQFGPTGGTFFVNSSLSRIDIFGNSPSTSFVSTPVSVGLNQPILAFNELKWLKRIEPVYYRIARRQYTQDMEDLGLKTTGMFFDVLAAQANVEMAQLNKHNSDTLYRLAQGRYNMGKIAENDLLQMELSVLNAGLAVQQATITFNSATAKMKSFLGLEAQDSLTLLLPKDPDSLHIDMNEAWVQAGQYSTNMLDYQRRSLEAARDVARARGDNGLKGNLFGQYGLNTNGYAFSTLYRQPQDQEQLRFGLTLPLMDWGKARGTIEVAKAQQQLVEVTLRQEKTDFEQQVILEAAQFNLQSSQLAIARRAGEVGQRRYFIAKQRYLLGKIDITDLNIAQADRDAANRGLLSVLRDAWESYYRIRKITLYDFKKHAPLEEQLSM